MKGVRDALGRLEGVKEVDVHLQSGMVNIQPSTRKSLPLEQIPDAISGAGFVPDRMEVTGIGRMEDGRFRFRGWKRSYPIADRDLEPGRRLQARVDYGGSSPRLVPIR